MILFLIDFRYIKQKRGTPRCHHKTYLGKRAKKKLINTKLKFLFDILLTNDEKTYKNVILNDQWIKNNGETLILITF